MPVCNTYTFILQKTLQTPVRFSGETELEWEVITAISSAAIALCALAYTVWQGKQAQKHNKLSFRPHLTSWSHQNSDKGAYAVEVMNNGLGPALIESFIVKIDGKIISGEGTEPIEKGLKILFPNIQYQSHQAYMANGYSMAAKEKCTVLAIQFVVPTSLTKEAIEHTLNRADLIIKYKSFYEEEFIYSSEDEKSNK